MSTERQDLALAPEEIQTKRRIPWHRTRLERVVLAELNRKSDAMGLLQTLGYLGALALTGAAAWNAALSLAWPWFLLALFVHGTGYGFIINGFHELCHSSVFRTKWLNQLFLHVFSFLGWYTPATSGPATPSTTSTPSTHLRTARSCCRPT